MSRYAYDDATLVSIINGTQTALDNMGQVNQRVLSISGQLPSVNNSTSGIKLATALGNWNTDFNRVVGNLGVLNEKAKALLQANRAADTDADGASNSAN